MAPQDWEIHAVKCNLTTLTTKSGCVGPRWPRSAVARWGVQSRQRSSLATASLLTYSVEHCQSSVWLIFFPPWMSGCVVHLVRRCSHGTLMREPSHGWAYGVLVLPRSTLTWAVPWMRGWDVPRCSHGTQARADPWMSGWGVSVTPRHSQARADPWMSGWGVSVTPRHSQTRADPWMSGWGVSVTPRHSQARADPWMSGWGVSVTPRHSQARADPWMSGWGVSVTPRHSQARADPWMSGWGVGVTPRHSQVRADPWMSGWGVSVTPRHSQARADPWMSGWGVGVTPRHSQARADPWMSGWGVSVTPRHSQVRADPWMSGWGVSVTPRHSQVRADPWMSGWGVGVTPRHSQVRAVPSDEWMCVDAALSPWHSQARAGPWMCRRGDLVCSPRYSSSESFPHGWVDVVCSRYSMASPPRWWEPWSPWTCTFVTEVFLHLPLLSESCDFSCFCCPYPLSLGSPPHGRDWPWSPAGFTFFSFFSGIYPSPLLFSVTGAVRLPVWGLLAGISGLPAMMLLLICYFVFFVWSGPESYWTNPDRKWPIRVCALPGLWTAKRNINLLISFFQMVYVINHICEPWNMEC